MPIVKMTTASGVPWVVIYFLQAAIESMLVVNLILLWFNLIPIPPLDGFHCMASLAEVFVGREVAKKIVAPFYLLAIPVIGFLILSSLFFVFRDIVMAIFA